MSTSKDYVNTLWQHVKIKNVLKDENQSFKIAVRGSFADMGIYLTEEMLYSTGNDDEEDDTSQSEDEQSQEDRKIQLCAGTDRTFDLTGKKLFMIHASWGSSHSEKLFAYPRFARNHNRYLLLNGMSPFFPFIFGYYQLLPETLLDDEEYFYVQPDDNVFANSVELSKFITQLRHRRYKNLTNKVELVFTETFKETSLWENFRQIVDNSPPLLGDGSIVFRTFRLYAMFFYTMFVSMIAVGYAHGDICHKNIRWTTSSDRALNFTKGGYAFHIEPYSFLNPTTSVIPLLIPSGCGVFQNDLPTLTPKEIGVLNRRYTQNFPLGEFGKDWIMAPEHILIFSDATLEEPLSSHESDLFCLGISMMFLILSSSELKIISQLNESDTYKNYLATLIKITKGETDDPFLLNRAHGFINLCVLLGATSVRHTQFKESKFWIAMSGYTREIDELHTLLIQNMTARIGNLGMEMLNSMTGWEPHQRISKYFAGYKSYFSPFLTFNDGDTTMNASTLYSPNVSHWGPQLGMNACVGTFDQSSQTVTTPLDRQSYLKPLFLQQLSGIKRPNLASETPFSKRTTAIGQDIFLCTHCQSTSQSLRELSSNSLPKHVLVCSTKCEQALKDNREFINHFRSDDYDIISSHLQNIC